MDWSHSLRLAAPEILLTVSALVLLLAAAWARGEGAARVITWLSAAAIAVAGTISAMDLCAGAAGAGTVGFSGLFAATAFAAFSKVLIAFAAVATLVIAPQYFDRLESYRAEYPVLVVLAVLGMGMMVSATNFMTLYIGLELNSLASYVLAAFLKNDDRSAEAGLKYFVLGSLASGMLLFGISLVYGFTGNIGFAEVAQALGAGLPTGAVFGLVFVLAGLAFKISAVPFHMWTPDVYEGAPTPVTAFFASAPKVAALSLTMAVALQAFGSQVEAWRPIVIFAALASIIWGAFGAIGQQNIKRLLAFSSINNVGFMLIGLAAGTAQGASAMLVYLAIYVPMTIGGFIAVLMLKDADGNPVENIADLAGLSRHRRVLAACMAMVMFSLAGIPPLFGFWGKFVVFQAAVQAGFISLAAIGIAASVIGAFYYLKVVKIMYFDEPAEKAVGKSDWVHQAVLAVCALAISPFGYLATKALAEWSASAAASLLPAAI
ncbi:NADH-quinone oxidoreductase subunit NuoN [Novosphingobium sp. TH158]|uniref:NADH-quinone oxidoreductase subunit NuoN n=1 Tax=Novosphingobium sp. TH158 TaxID=2067455 RepID=UPI000C7A34D9|nr:NADH-quinone oxidoreductase subunit NuoN [Novosphingobium sp. TH158]PLK25811.1 NADH-quinone oxidoreductase subunit NuoN [Novosphingobium sp. TH158]